MARLWPALLMRHGPFLARLVFSNEKTCSVRARPNTEIRGAGLGAGTFGRRRFCKRNPWRRTMLSNVYAITGTHYFHQSNFNFRPKHHHFHPEKIYLLRFVCIDPASISVKEGLFSSRQHSLHLEITHCILAKGESSFHFNQSHCDFFIHPASISTLSKLSAPKRPCPKVTYPKILPSHSLKCYRPV